MNVTQVKLISVAKQVLKLAYFLLKKPIGKRIQAISIKYPCYKCAEAKQPC